MTATLEDLIRLERERIERERADRRRPANHKPGPYDRWLGYGEDDA
jgi:hypothetical protein